MEKTNRISVFRRNTNKLKVEGLVFHFPIKKKKGMFLDYSERVNRKKEKITIFPL